ncbi:MAG: phage tail sheath C-terminal domain-containing protein [Pseudomonadota bacterium]
MDQYKTPGVYIVEKNAFPNSVVEVATAVPAFLGYTQTALRGKQILTNVPTRITSLSEFEMLFGGAPQTRFARGTDDAGNPVIAPTDDTRFLLYNSMRLFFDNGGAACWIVSVGPYVDGNNAATTKARDDFRVGLDLLEKEPEPTMLVIPDAVVFGRADWETLSGWMFQHCTKLRDRVAIFDVYDGHLPRVRGDGDVIRLFREAMKEDLLSYGTAYYPWVHATVVSGSELDFRALDMTFAGELATEITTELKLADMEDGDDKDKLTEMVAAITNPPDTEVKITRAHNSLLQLSETYRHVMDDTLRAANLLPPAAAMAGVYARTDATFGVFKAPANTGLASVSAPCVTISQEEQEDLNVPVSGKAVNAIRTFMGRGVMVWGARTLDGNSQDWRYISVRRTMIFLEQSIKGAAQAYVFSPNTSSTWITVANMIRNFLNNQWKAGALAGATPDEAYQVTVGLGSTMTAQDILDGYMRISVRVAVTRPAEFIEITFQQKMQTS